MLQIINHIKTIMRNHKLTTEYYINSGVQYPDYINSGASLAMNMRCKVKKLYIMFKNVGENKDFHIFINKEITMTYELNGAFWVLKS